MGSKPTISDVAREAGVSIATVSYVLNGKKSITVETRSCVMEAIKKLNYVPNMSARNLGGSNSLMIGILVPQTESSSTLLFQNPFYGEILGAIESEARANGYHLIISGVDFGESYIDLARKRNLDGIIAIGVYPNGFYADAGNPHIPIVFVDSYNFGYHYHSIRIDDTYGSYLATKYLIQKGHRSISFFCGRLRDNGVMKKRLLGYKQAIEEYEIPFDETLIFEGDISFQSGMTLAEDFMRTETPSSAVLTAADVLAIGAIKGFTDAGKHIPSDISIMGFDDLEISQYVPPGLTTVKQQIALKGKKSVELLLQSIREPDMTKREEILPISIVERSSVRDLNSSEGV